MLSNFPRVMPNVSRYILFVIAAVFTTASLSADSVSSSAMPVTKPGSASGSSSTKLPENPFPKEKVLPPPPKIPINKPSVTVPTTETLFSFPGIVGVKDGKWLGSDNLFNVPNSVQLYVELIKPENQMIPLHKEALRSAVQEILSKGGIGDHALVQQEGIPPLPMLHILVMITSFDKACAACCACRLFESVELKRVILAEGITFQAITWEKQEIVVASQSEIEREVNSTVKQLVQSYVDRYKHFADLQKQINAQH